MVYIHVPRDIVIFAFGRPLSSFRVLGVVVRRSLDGRLKMKSRSGGGGLERKRSSDEMELVSNNLLSI